MGLPSNEVDLPMLALTAGFHLVIGYERLIDKTAVHFKRFDNDPI